MVPDCRIYFGLRDEDGEASVSVVRFNEDYSVCLGVDPLTHYPHHSPDGFEWGYMGSGPADLAFAIIADHYGESYTVESYHRTPDDPDACSALGIYMDFKNLVVSRLSSSSWSLTSDQVATYLSQIRKVRGDQASLELGPPPASP